MNNSRTVWILGAGFSKPLDYPLMDELFTETVAARLRERHADLRFTQAHKL